MYDAALSFTTKDGGREGVSVMKLIGPLTLSNMFSFQTELTTNKPPAMIFDLSEVPYMDSAGLGVLLNYYVSAERQGRRMALAGVNPRVDELFVMTKVKDLLRNFPTVDEALSQI